MERRFTAVRRFQSQVSFGIYACNNNEDRYTDAAAMRKLATLTMTVSDPSKVICPDEYRICVRFSFGATELEVTAYDMQTEEEVQTSVVFVAD